MEQQVEAGDVHPKGIITDTYGLFLTLLLPALLVCALVPTILLRKWQKLKLPPGPPALPIIGHLHLLGPNPHHSLCNLSKTYGPLMYLHFGSVPVMVASSPTMAKQILQIHDRIFAWRMHPAVHTGADGILFSQPGPYLKLMRQLCLTDLFGPKRLKSFQPVIAEEVHALLRSIADATAEVPVRAKLYTATNNIISRMALGKKLPDLATRSQADPAYNIMNLLVETLHLAGIFNVGDYIPWLAWMDLQGCVRNSKENKRKVSVVWQEVIDGRREQKNKKQEVDFLDVLMSASESTDVPFTDLNIMAILTDIFIGGIDTSSITVEWALGELLANPTKMKKVQEELEQIVGMSRLVQESDIPRPTFKQW